MATKGKKCTILFGESDPISEKEEPGIIKNVSEQTYTLPNA